MRILTVMPVLALIAGAAFAAPAAKPATPAPVPVIEPASPPIPAAEVEKWFPTRPVQADVMDVVTDPRYDQIVGKMRTAITKQPEWWQDYASKNADKQGVVPWDPKLGITKAEYDDMMRMAKDLRLARIASTTLTFKREANGDIVVNGGSAAPELTGLRIAKDRQTVSGPYGVLKGRKDVHQKDLKAPSGLWDGVQWNGADKDPSGASRLSFLATGRMKPSNKGLMFLSLRQLNNGRVIDKSRIVSYAIAAP